MPAPTAENPLRVAVVGAGPAGIYTADALSAQTDVPVVVDVLDRLPTPYGLVRYGVAPDHLKMKNVAAALHKVLERPGVRFLGNVEVGQDVHTADLDQRYDAIVWSYGASTDRRLGIEGEDLAGSTSATEFVNWYCGHPDSPLESYLLDATAVAVVGVGNVAVDVARILAKTADDLLVTDVHDEALGVLAQSHITDIHVLGRRGPVQAKWTTKELRELGELANADVVVRADEVVLDAASERDVAEHKDLARNLEVIKGWVDKPLEGKPRRIHLRFLVRPVGILGTDRVEGVTLERMQLDGNGGVTGTGETEVLPVQMVFRSVGYQGRPLVELPFDERSATVPNDAGRVLSDGAPQRGHYVAGWIKRGPTGVIGTNRSDASETVTSMLADVESGALAVTASDRDPDSLARLVHERGGEVVTWDGWLRIDAAEIDKGTQASRTRVKIPLRPDLLHHGRG
ncbi:MAG TPA: FAD-dependent oxidoreductase [Mycobacteriales bacterium]|nr:FAD-dependent oxidoreductase [Mycobacteriales bacterium]